MLIYAVLYIISVISRRSVHLYMLSGVSVNSTPHSIFPNHLLLSHNNHRGNNGRCLERNESCSNDYHQSSVNKWSSRESNQESPVLMSCMLLSALWGLALTLKNTMLGTWVYCGHSCAVPVGI